jgi:hypothetical protein
VRSGTLALDVDYPAGLDVRGEGGFIIVPPSHTTRPYEVRDELPLASRTKVASLAVLKT